MSLNMDENQRKAVMASGTDILVSASAGAGKTRVLVERLIKRCVEDRVGMDEILALTFTAAAAAEMKNRTALRLQEILNEETDPEKQEWLRKQMILLSAADITTIDAFCLTVIRKYCSMTGLDPAVSENVLDGAASEAFFDQAFHESLETYAQEHRDLLIRTMESFSGRSEDTDALKKVIRAIVSHAGNAPDPFLWLRNIKDDFHPVSRLNQLPQNILDGFYAALTLRFTTIRLHFDRMLRYASDSEKLQKKMKELNETSVRLDNCRKYLDAKDYDLFREAFISFGEQFNVPADGKALVYTAERKAVTAACEKLTSVLYDSSVLVKDHIEVCETVHVLCDLAELTLKRFTGLKRENCAMDFTDMERYAWDILSAYDGFTAELYRKRLKEVMVDEFQDTSLLQNEIIKKVARPGTIFRVGDVKQSIYRFRQAKPSLMRSLAEDENTLGITLEHNYRSSDVIVRFCNTLFARLMNTDAGEDSYSERDFVTVGTERQKDPAAGPVRFVILPSASASDSEEEIPENKRIKAMWIASEIQRQVSEKGRDWKDFVILVRSHKDKGIIRAVFEQYGIPYDIDTREGFYNSPLCMIVRSMLEWMTDPTNALAALAVLTSPFCSLDDKTLAALKISYKSVLNGIRAEHPEILEEMRQLYDIGTTLGITAMLDEIARRHDFYEALDHSQRANFDLLFETAVKMEQNNEGFFDLLEKMQSSAEEKSSEAISRGKDDHVVTVTTIHQSKGLQYPVVFLWSSEQSRPGGSPLPVLVDDELGIGILHIDLPWQIKRQTVSYIACAHKNECEDLEEYTRLLYVALTRAEQELIIVDSLKKEIEKKDEITMSVLAERKGMSGLILSAADEIPGLFSIERPGVPEPDTLYLRREGVKKLPRYTGETEILPPLMTPSQTEMQFLPDLDMHVRGRRFGIRIHEIIADRPDGTWTEKDLDIPGLSEADKAHLLAFNSSGLYQESLTKEIHKEYPFYIENDSIRMHGVMDFAAVGKDDIILIDFKTDAVSDKELLNRYTDQVRAYRSALETIWPDKTVRAFLWSFQRDTAVPVR